MTPLPRETRRKKLRKPMSPRVGMVYSMRTLPSPSCAMSVMTPRRAESSSVSWPMKLLTAFDGEPLIGLVQLAVDVASDGLGLRHLKTRVPPGASAR